jgi:hypothetical protein
MAVLKRGVIFGVIIGLLVCFSASLFAQEDKNEPEDKIEKFTRFIKKKRVNAAYVMGGLNKLNLDTLNRHLEKDDYPPLQEGYLTYGVGGHIIHNKFIVGLEIHRFLERNAISSKAFNTSAYGKYFLLNFGYLLHEKKGLMVYPLAGMGFGQLKLRVTENNIHSFQDINNFQKGSESITRSFLVNLAVGADYFFNYNQEKKGKNSLMVGIRAGYMFSAIKDDWSVNHVHVADGPNAGLSSPYICIVFGLGGWMEKFIEIAIS